MVGWFSIVLIIINTLFLMTSNPSIFVTWYNIIAIVSFLLILIIVLSISYKWNEMIHFINYIILINFIANCAFLYFSSDPTESVQE